MKAITIKQPWANLIVSGVKDIENRTWKTNFRGRIYVHASQKPVHMNGMEDGFKPTMPQLKEILQLHPASQGRWPDIMAAYPNSAIIGEIDIIDCVLNHKSIWAQHAMTYEVATTPDEKYDIKPVWNWVLANPVKYDAPILNVKGKLSFWDFSLTNSELTINPLITR